MNNSRSKGTPLMAYTRFSLYMVADSVEKVASLKSLQICQNTNDIFDLR
jgi:hypothetical protein